MNTRISKENGAIVGVLFAVLLSGPSFAGMHVRPVPFQVGPNPSAIVATDLNGDEWPEIITADRGVLSDLREERPANDELSLLIAQGDLKYEKLHPSLKTDFGPYALAVANIDAHKWPDILVASFHATRHRDLYLFLNLRDEGIFQPEFFGVESDTLAYNRQMDGDGVPVYHRPALTSLDAGDINKDGLRDVLATGWGSDVLVYFQGDPETHFKAPVLVDLPGAPFCIKLADFNHDSTLDFAVTLMATNEVAIWQGDGAGNFTEVERFASRGRLPHRLQVADINQDGQRDLVVSHKHTDDSIVVFYGTGNFSFGVSQEIMLGTDRNVLEEGIQDITVSDFNNDGFPDIAAACFSSERVVVLTTDNSKNKPFLEFPQQSYQFKGGQPRALCSADLNRDGRADIAVALWGLNSVGLLLNE